MAATRTSEPPTRLPEHPHLADAPAVFTSDRFDVVTLDLPRASGGATTRGVAWTRDSVVALALTRDGAGRGAVVLIRNERPAVGRVLWELPAGTMEPGEDAAACAGRELAEEAGYAAATLRPLLAFYPCPGFATEHMHAFVATGLTQVGQSLDETERIEPVVVPVAEAMRMVRDGEIEDAKTIAVLLYWQAFKEGV